MLHHYLGRIPFSVALEAQEQAVREQAPQILGFETNPVVTLGRRANESDLIHPPEAHGFERVRVDRGGQATIHNPGQLVIFPLWNVRQLGARKWILALADITRASLRHWGIDAKWNCEEPGLYTARGKIMSCGVRIRSGFSTHGIAINVSNDLSDFTLIRTCGREGAAMDRMGGDVLLPEVFAHWLWEFQCHFALSPQLTRPAISKNLGPTTAMRS